MQQTTNQHPQISTHKFSEGLTFEGFRQIMQNFARERDWEQYHTPRNLLLAYTGEVGELCELFQWKGEVKTGLPEFSEHEKTRVGEEMADCMAYLFRLADTCEIDLTKAIFRKMELNAKKYPVEKCKGKSEQIQLFGGRMCLINIFGKKRKYTEYSQEYKSEQEGADQVNQETQKQEIESQNTSNSSSS